MNWHDFQAFLVHPLVIAFGWALFHFLWQALLIAGIIGAVVTLMHRASARARYLVAYVGMSLLALTPIVTTVWCYSQQQSETRKIPQSSAFVNTPQHSRQWVEIVSSSETSSSTWDVSNRASAIPKLQPHDAAGVVPELSRMARYWYLEFEAWLPLTVGCWGICVLSLSARLTGGLWRVNQLRRVGTSPASKKLLAAFQKAKAALAIPFAVTILESTRAGVPMVIGFLRPVILVPTSVAIGLTPNELESLLAHELAHVRRHDYLLNLIQTVIETLLFYHPVVWWLSRLVRSLREDCCDDEAIRVSGNRMVLARALAQIEEIRCRDEGFALAASDGSLLRRIRRVVGREESPRSSWWLAGLISLCLVLGLTVAGGLTLASTNLRPISEGQKDEKDEKDASDGRDGRDGSREGDSGLASNRKDSDDKFPTYRREVDKVDSRSGARKSLLAEVTLTNNSREEKPDDSRLTSKLDMVYSTVFSYSVIPSRVARELNAEVLGEIDFGNEPPKSPTPQILLNLPLTSPDGGLKTSASLPGFEPVQPEMPANPTVYRVGDDVGEDRNVKFVPFENDSIWVPGHLAFYSMNATNQTKFKVVRFDQVNLGLGPKFGPAYALVSDDANSDFGVLGRDWAAKPRGPNGEGFVWAATGEFYFMKFQMNEPAEKTDAVPAPNKASENPKNQEDTPRFPSIPMPPQPQRPETAGRNPLKVLASHTYDLNQRSSNDWIEIDGVQVPVDAGVEHEGIRVYVTLMFDVVAVDAANKKALWHDGWQKSDPIFSSISIVEIKEGESSRAVVQLIPSGKQNDPSLHQFRDLKTGKEISREQVLQQVELANPKSTDPTQPATRPDIHWRRISEEAGKVTHVELASDPNGRTAPELVERFAEALERVPNSWVTDFETLVSAENATHIDNSIDATEIIFNLPEGSGIRAELKGERIEFLDTDAGQEVVVTGGRVELYDAGGVLRAWASPDGGAEQLVVDVRLYANEYALRMKTRRVKPSPEYPQPPVQAAMFCETGAQKDEPQPPHGAVRYELQPPAAGSKEPYRMKMKWHYDLKRLSVERDQEELPQTSNRPPKISQPVGLVGPWNSDETYLEMVVGHTEMHDWLNQPVRFDSLYYRQLARRVQSMDSAEERTQFLKLLVDKGLDAQVFVLCRMMFQAKPGGEFRPPRLGSPFFIGTSTEAENFPLAPIDFVDDMPILVVQGYQLAGQREGASDYLQYCLNECDWTTREFRFADEGPPPNHLNLISAPFWGKDLDEAEWREFFWVLRQLNPETVGLFASQQPWVNKTLSLFSLDDGTRVSPEDVVEKAHANEITIVLYDNCRLDWLREIATPIIKTGRSINVVRWQQNQHFAPIKDAVDLEAYCAAFSRGKTSPSANETLTLELKISKTSYKADESVSADLRLINGTEKPQAYDPQNFAPFRVIRVTRADDDQPDWFIGMTPQTSGFQQDVAAGDSVELWKDVDLGSLYLLDEGKYKVQVVWIDRENKRELKSNQVELEISGGTLSPNKQLLKALKQITPAGFEVSCGYGEIYISHSPTNLKRDVTTITLSIQEDKALDGSVRAEYLGKHAAGHIYLSAPPKAKELWASHRDEIKGAVFPQTARAKDRNQPWQVTGTVTDPDGKPMAGVVIRAHCGAGTLHLTGESTSDSDGKYVLNFGPGIWGSDPKMVQAATISVHKEGYFEKNLHRQGDKLAAMEKPTGELGWGDRTIEDVFLPDQPKTIDFQMLPATKMAGIVIDSDGKRLEGVRVSLVGPDMPPSSSVVAATRTDKGGQFELLDLPTGYKYQILIEPAKAESPWLGWASPPLELSGVESANNCFKYLKDNQTVEVTADQLWLEIKGGDTNWKDALANAAKKPLAAKFNGLSNSEETRISAGMFYIELGD